MTRENLNNNLERGLKTLIDTLEVQSEQGTLERLLKYLPQWNEKDNSEPLYSSFISDDQSPFEYSVAFEHPRIDIRLLYEVYGQTGSLSDRWVAGIEHARNLAATLNLPLSRFEAIKDLFEPDILRSKGAFSIWHGISLLEGRLDYKIYLNPEINGRNPIDVVLTMFDRLGFKAQVPIIKLLEASLTADDSVPYISLDISDDVDARVKIYLAHLNPDLSKLDHLYSLAQSYRQNDVRVWTDMYLPGISFPDRPVGTCFSFQQYQAEPSTVTLHLPIGAFRPDALRTGELSLPSQIKVQLDQIYRRLLEVNRQKHTNLQYLSLRRAKSGDVRYTAYLASCAFKPLP